MVHRTDLRLRSLGKAPSLSLEIVFSQKVEKLGYTLLPKQGRPVHVKVIYAYMKFS